MLKRYKLTDKTYYYEITSNNVEQTIELINKADVDVGLSLNFNVECFTNVDFIHRVKRLVGLRIIGDYEDLKLISAHEGIKNLILEQCKNTSINFSKMKSLIKVRADWHPCLNEVFKTKGLQHLALWGYKPEDKNCTDLKKLKKLKSLMLTRGNVKSLDGLEGLKKLESVELNYIRTLNDVMIWLH